VFIWTGGIKSAAPDNFQQHLTSLGWIPHKLVRWAVAAVAGLEVGLGTALLLLLSPQLVLPATALLLILLSAVSWYGVQSGKTVDCGCYGGYIQPSIWQSVGLNAVFVVILVTARILAVESGPQRTWKFGLAVAAGIVAFAVADYSHRYAVRHRRPLIETNPLKVGAKWKKAWSGKVSPPEHGDAIVAFLGPDCPFCHQWVRFLNAMSASPSLPGVTGVLGSSTNRKETFVHDHGIRFATVTVSPSLMARLSPAVPTTVLISDRRIKEIWVGAMPPVFYERFREAFFPGVGSKITKESDAVSATVGPMKLS
jgi:hypothetical protein